MKILDLGPTANFAVSLILILPLSQNAAAQVLGPDPERVAFESPEGWATGFFGSILLPSGFGPPPQLDLGRWELGLELSEVPELSIEEQRVGFGGVKVDDLNKAEFLVRPTFTVGLPFRFSTTVSFIPPVEIWDLESTLFSISINRAILDRGPLRAGFRAFFSYGESTGAFTCSEYLVAEGHDLFDCTPPSVDTSYLRSHGLEASLSYRIDAAGGLTPFLSLSWQHMNNDFQTDVIVFNGTQRDRRTLKTSGDTVALNAGLSLPIASRWLLAMSLFYSPLKVNRTGIQGEPSEEDALVHLRTRLSYRF